MSFQLLLPHPIYEEMLQHARAELPNECVGVLAARDQNLWAMTPEQRQVLVVRVEKAYPLINSVASAVECVSDGKSKHQADRDISTRGLEIVATYHSHPSAPPKPSKKDIEWHYAEFVMNFIISLQKQEPEVRAWWLTATEYWEASWELCE